MDKHIDVLGYVLVATVFSVGFLSNRVHVGYDAWANQINDLSSRIQERLAQDRPPGPVEVDQWLAAVRRAADPVTFATRILNRGIVLASTVVFVSGLSLLAGATSRPAHALVLLVAVWSTGTAVGVLGEIDVRRVERDLKGVIDRSVLGRLESLAESLARQDDGQATAVLNRLRIDFPSWGLLQEWDALLSLRAGQPSLSLTKIDQVIEGGGDLHLAATVAVASALVSNNPARGRTLLVSIERRAGADRNARLLRRSLALQQGHAGALFGGLTADRADDQRDQLADQFLLDMRYASRPTDGNRLSLDLDPNEVTETRQIIDLFERWLSNDKLESVAALARGTPLYALIRLVCPGPEDPEADQLAVDISTGDDGIALEALGLVQLARGETREAATSFNKASRLMPASARAHWGAAVVSLRAGWLEKAVVSASRSEALQPDRAAVRLVAHLAGGRDAWTAEQAQMYFATQGGPSAANLAEFALLGYDLRADQAHPRIASEVFLHHFIDRALVSERRRTT